jgi:hypothetical protein
MDDDSDLEVQPELADARRFAYLHGLKSKEGWHVEEMKTRCMLDFELPLVSSPSDCFLEPGRVGTF